MNFDIEAELFVIPESEGGRRRPFFSGYRPQFRFQNLDNDVNITILDRHQLSGGETGKVAITFRVPDLQTGRLFVGANFEIAEGARVVCHGTITTIHNATMISNVSR